MVTNWTDAVGDCDDFVTVFDVGTHAPANTLWCSKQILSPTLSAFFWLGGPFGVFSSFVCFAINSIYIDRPPERFQLKRGPWWTHDVAALVFHSSFSVTSQTVSRVL